MNNFAIEDCPIYPKIYGPFKRFTDGPLKNKLDWYNWSCPEFELLADLDWYWTEKIDGTNIRVYWDGYNIHFGGRTNKADLPKKLLENMAEIFEPNLFEQSFQEKKVCLYGEGFGAGIQKGGTYSASQTFALFDVRLLESDTWLQPQDVQSVAEGLGVLPAPHVDTCSVGNAIQTVEDGLTSWWKTDESPSDWLSEGLVGTPVGGFRNRNGVRIQMKVKTVDFL